MGNWSWKSGSRDEDLQYSLVRVLWVPQQSLLKMESGLKQWAGGRKYGGKDLHNVLAMGGVR